MKNVAFASTRGFRCAWATTVVAAAALAATATAASAAELAATPGNLTAVFSSAQAGDTVLLSAGDYGLFQGAMKPGVVTLRPQPGVKAVMELKFAPASNITLDGVTIEDGDLGDSRTKNITIRNADIPGQILFRAGELRNANILLENNLHRDFNAGCNACAEGRIAFINNTEDPIGVTIQYSEFRGGQSDGIQTGANGLRILNNSFHDLVPGTPDGVHTDAIQLYGSKNTLIQGNHFHTTGGPFAYIMAPDGGENEIIADNAFAPNPGFYSAVQLGSHTGTQFTHNTVDGIQVKADKKVGGTPSSNVVVRDNAFTAKASFSTRDSAGAESCNSCTISYNLFATSSVGRGTNSIIGLPIFVGGAQPASYAGYVLADGSPGKGNASDGTDRGIRPGVVPGPAPASGGGGGATGTGTATVTVKVLSSLRSAVRTGRLRLRITSSAAGKVTLNGSIVPGRRIRGHRGEHSRRALRIRPRTLSFSRASSRRISVMLKRKSRRALNRSRDARLALRAYGDEQLTQSLGSFSLRVKR